MQMTRDLLILSGIAFKEGNYQQAGILFASAMNSNDATDFFNSLGNNSSLSALASNWGNKSAESTVDFVDVVEQLAKSMKAEDNYGENFAAEASDDLDDLADAESESMEITEEDNEITEFDEDGNPLLEFDPSSEDGVLLPPSFASSRQIKIRPGQVVPKDEDDEEDEEQASIIEID